MDTTQPSTNTAGTPDGAAPASAHPVATPGLPTKDADFMNTAQLVSAAWTANPQITLLWTNADEFAGYVSSYSGALKGRLRTGSKRPLQTQTLDGLDAQIDAATTEVKVYIEKKYKKKTATPQFARFGIAKEGGNYRLPRDRDKRSAALELMTEAIDADGFGNEEYGSAFWSGIVSAYDTALKAAGATDGGVSTGVADKNMLKKIIKKTMKSLRLVIEGNNPDTFAAVYRKWGWQKEDY